uniref:fibrinogen-like protein 1 n=1 Tax=Styela clava TaxID=7725 RepID=UPI001939C7FE|nr:fibrinogen-like protein 1 [Styela clava]
MILVKGILFAVIMVTWMKANTQECSSPNEQPPIDDHCEPGDPNCGEFIIEAADLENGFENKPELLEFIRKQLDRESEITIESTAMPTNNEKQTQTTESPSKWSVPDAFGTCNEDRCVNMNESALFGHITVKAHGEIISMPISDEKNVTVYCECESDKEYYYVIQRRIDGSVDFDREFEDYVSGFGNMTGNFWIGLETIHLLTSSADYWKLDFVMKGNSGSEKGEVRFMNFKLGNRSTNYRFDYTDFGSKSGKTLETHFEGMKNMIFKVRDKEGGGCPGKSGWWFNDDTICSLNGPYKGKSGVKTDRGARHYKIVEMRLIPENEGT